MLFEIASFCSNWGFCGGCHQPMPEIRRKSTSSTGGAKFSNASSNGSGATAAAASMSD